MKIHSAGFNVVATLFVELTNLESSSIDGRMNLVGLVSSSKAITGGSGVASATDHTNPLLLATPVDLRHPHSLLILALRMLQKDRRWCVPFTLILIEDRIYYNFIKY